MIDTQRLKMLFAVLLSGVLIAPQTTAKALFDMGSTQYVGIHYWFENAGGEKFADPAGAGAGSQVSLHVRSNVAAFLTVWMSDANHPSIELTSRTDAGPDGKWTGYRLAAETTFVVPREFVVSSSGNDADRVIIFLGRSKTEQVNSMAGAREKLQRIAARKADDGDSVIVQEVDRTTSGRIGTYVVHRTGGQTGSEIVMAVK